MISLLTQSISHCVDTVIPSVCSVSEALEVLTQKCRIENSHRPTGKGNNLEMKIMEWGEKDATVL